MVVETKRRRKSSGLTAPFNPPLAGMVVETPVETLGIVKGVSFNPPLAGMVVETHLSMLLPAISPLSTHP